VRELRFFSLLPYSSVWFFLILFPVVLLLHILRPVLEKSVSYSRVLLVLTVGFFVCFFPQPVHIFVFGAYFYFYYHLQNHPRFRISQVEALFFTLLPMVVARSTREIQFVGLSYVTFRAFHVIMDSPFLERIPPSQHFSFLMFFPSILAGPIDRYQNFKKQVGLGYARLNARSFAVGYRMIVLGAAMKFVMGDLVQTFLLPEGGIARPWRYPAEFYGYPLFLYLDFAGYSAMAIGCALMLGFVSPENFDRPYLSRNPQDFWRRFHITLGAWLTDYFFKPIYKLLHGQKVLRDYPLLKQNIAIFLTFLLMGCWNGMKAHYLISGALFGLYSVIFNSYVYRRRRSGAHHEDTAVKRRLAILLTVHACCLALYFFGGRTELFR
jgi:membrane protein involved in D-alanine export